MSVFTCPCEDVFKHRFVADVDTRLEAIAAYKGMCLDTKWKKLGPGTLDDILVKRGSVFDAGRRQKVSATPRGEEYTLASSDDEDDGVSVFFSDATLIG